MIALLAVMDAAALDVAFRSNGNHGRARLFLSQGIECLREVSYPMRRVEASVTDPGVTRSEFEVVVGRMCEAGYPMDTGIDEAWGAFAEMRSGYAPLASALAFWLITVPAPWSGTRDGFEDEPVRWPEHWATWSI